MSIQSRTPGPARRFPPRPGTPELAILALIGMLALGAALLGGGAPRRSGPAVPAQVTPAHIALVERRVEALRGLRFAHPVPVAVVSPAQARGDGLADFDRQPAAARRATTELLTLLGLLPPGSDLRRIESSVYGEQVAGYYDPRRRRLSLVRGAGVDDVTLAHELTHALEDQHVDLGRLQGARDDDASTAEQALVEGTATLVMERYAARWPSRAPLGDALAGLTQVTSATPLPQYTMRELIFPYLQGEQFAQALRDADGGGWALVDVAERARPPRTTAEILQPQRWLRAQQPVAVSVVSAPPRAAGWRALAGSTLGEEDLAALLAPQSGALAARGLTGGWRGGRYALWRRGPLDDPRCGVPCRPRDALELAVALDGPASARALAAGLGSWMTQALHGRPLGGGAWRLRDGSAGAVRVRGALVRAALAPDAALARRLVR